MHGKRNPAARGRALDEILLTETEHGRLNEWARSGKTAQALALRARIILNCAEGLGNREIARRLGLTPQTVGKWRARFVARRLQGLLDEPRPGAPRRIEDATVEAIIAKTLRDRPAHASRWSARAMARTMDLSGASVVRIWRAFGLHPRRQDFSPEGTAVSEARELDVAGVYVSAGIKAIALCLMPARHFEETGRPGPEEQTLQPEAEHSEPLPTLSALDMAAATQHGPQHWRRGAQEFVHFLEQIDAIVPADYPVHVIMSSSGLHPQVVETWMRRHPRFHRHLAPARSAWTSQLERWFRLLFRTKRHWQRSAHDFEVALRQYLDHVDEPRPFIWIKDSARTARP